LCFLQVKIFEIFFYFFMLFLMKKFFVHAFLCVFSFSSLAFALNPTFSFADKDDIPEWAAIPIATLMHRGVLGGNANGTFSPFRPMNRAEFCKMLVIASGVSRVKPDKPSFPDVKKEDWFFEFVETAKSLGWLSGYPDGYFRPGNNINRSEIAKMVTLAFSLNVPKQESHEVWHDPYFKALDRAKLLAFDTNFGEHHPGIEPSRAEVSEQIFRALIYSGEVSPFELAALWGEDWDKRDALQKIASAQKIEDFFFDYVDEPWGVMSPGVGTGSLYFVKNSSLPEKVVASKGRKVLALSLNIATGKRGQTADIGTFKFRRIGAGLATDFSSAWLEIDGTMFSSEVRIVGDVVEIPFKTLRKFTSEVRTVDLYVVPSITAKSGRDSRFVLFMPSWVDSNAQSKIGLFPFGGSDISVQ